MSRGAHLTRRYHPERLENRKSDDIYLQAMWWWFRSTRSEQTEIATIDVCHGIPARLCVWRVALGCRGTTCIETLTYYTSSWLWWVSKKKKGKLVRQHWLRLVTSSFFFAHISGIKRETLTDHADNLTDDWYFKRIPRVYFCIHLKQIWMRELKFADDRWLFFFLFFFFSFLTHRFLPSF